MGLWELQHTISVFSNSFAPALWTGSGSLQTVGFIHGIWAGSAAPVTRELSLPLNLPNPVKSAFQLSRTQCKSHLEVGTNLRTRARNSQLQRGVFFFCFNDFFYGIRHPWFNASAGCGTSVVVMWSSAAFSQRCGRSTGTGSPTPATLITGPPLWCSVPVHSCFILLRYA